MIEEEAVLSLLRYFRANSWCEISANRAICQIRLAFRAGIAFPDERSVFQFITNKTPQK